MKRVVLTLALLALPAIVVAQVVSVGQGQLTLNSTNGGEKLSATSTPIASVSVRASCANTIDIMVGGMTLSYSGAVFICGGGTNSGASCTVNSQCPGATCAGSKGRYLMPCEPMDFEIDNLNKLYLDAGTTASQVVEYDYVVGP